MRYSTRFGTFLHNTENEREQEKLHEKTLSLWPWLLQPEQIKIFKNSQYILRRQTIFLSTCIPEVWMEFYSRYKPSLLNISKQPIQLPVNDKDIENTFYEKTLNEHRLISKTFDLSVQEQDYEDEEIITLNDLLSFTEQPVVTRHVRDLSRQLFDDYVPSSDINAPRNSPVTDENY